MYKITRISDGVQFIPYTKKRPRLCHVCHARATHVEITTKDATHIGLDGTVKKGKIEKALFFCSEH